MSSPGFDKHGNIASRIVALFIDSKITPLVVLGSIFLGAAAIMLLPREEEPQIVVPMVDVFVEMPGASAQEVEQRITRPLEKLLWEIPGIEYLYSTSSEGRSLVIVRFIVGHSANEAIVTLNAKIAANLDRIPPGVSQPLIKIRSIDDVPILALTFWSDRYDHAALRRVVAQVDDSLKQVEDVSETTLLGGYRRRVRVTPDRLGLTARGLSLTDLMGALQKANQQLPSGALVRDDTVVQVETGAFLQNSTDVESVVVGVYAGRPVYIRDVARVSDGADEPDQYVFFKSGQGHASVSPNSDSFHPAVTLSVAKRQGTNAVTVSSRVLEKLKTLQGTIIPSDVNVSITRHYGQTAAEKSDELLFHMGLAVLSVAILIGFVLGWRESAVVAIAIPVTLALTLASFYFLGFTLNRITLFALIFSIGILVDDPIVDVENIVRHMRMAVKGTVLFDGVPPAPVVYEITPDKKSGCTCDKVVDESLVVDKATGGLKWAIVRIMDAKAKDAPPKPAGPVQIDQKGCVFSPHVIVVPPETDLEVLNPDAILHNVHSTAYDFANPSQNFVASPTESKIVYKAQWLKEPEIIEIKCDIHSWMNGFIVVHDPRYCAVTGVDGSFEIKTFRWESGRSRFITKSWASRH